MPGASSRFRGNFPFARIGHEEFLELYEPLLPHLDPGLVLLAECDGSLSGYVLP